jgi:beta-lactam-binding protein with PASTA domain
VLEDGTVPDVEHLGITDAVALLEAGGYEIRVSWVPESPYMTPGTIAEQQPQPGADLHSGSTVEIAVAGPAPGTVIPGVVGRHYLDAQARLEGAGNVVTIVEMADPSPDDNTASNLVWGQFPSGDEPTTGRVTIWVQP